MRWQATFTVFIFIAFSGFRAQTQTAFERVDRQKIERLINDVSLPSFYPILLERFQAFDTTLSLADYRLLYYGYVFSPAYSWQSDQKKREMSIAMQADQYSRVIQLADSVLEANPMSLSAHYFRAYAMMNHDEKDSSYQRYVKRYNGLRNAILSSGDGLSCKTAFRTIYLEDEYEIMYRYFEMDTPTSQILENSCDRFSVTPSGTYQNTEIYFDISETVIDIQKQLNLHFPQ